MLAGSIVADQVPPQDQARIERLVALCKLWSAAKYFHPYLAYRDDIDWDQALFETIDKVNAAHGADDYAAAVDSMLKTLDDSASHVVRRNAPATAKIEPSTRPRDPSSKSTNDGIL